MLGLTTSPTKSRLVYKNIDATVINTKTWEMIILKKRSFPKCTIKVDGINLEQVHNFKYLITWLIADGRYTKDRIGQVKSHFMKLKTSYAIPLCQLKYNKDLLHVMLI